MNKSQDLLGKKYPVKSAKDNSIIGYKTIKYVIELENVAGVLINLRDAENIQSGLILGYKEMSDIIDNNLYQDLENELG